MLYLTRCQSYIRASAHCEYDSGYLIFDGHKDYIEVWRLASDFAVDNEGASHSPPDEGQRRASTFVAAMHHRYVPRGHFRPWAKLSFPEPTLRSDSLTGHCFVRTRDTCPYTTRARALL